MQFTEGSKNEATSVLMNPVNDSAMFHWRKKNHSPLELQLAKANAMGHIIIPSGPKFNVRWFFSFSET
jgi:hypothetical protein